MHYSKQKIRTQDLIFKGVILIGLVVTFCNGLEKRDRWSGLNKVEPSTTMGKGNAYLSMYGRAFLWDNAAAGKIPTALPHLELGYGVLDFLQLSGGVQVRTTRPSLLYLKFKLTTLNTKSIRTFGVGQTVEMYRNTLDEFKSNGLRSNNEGFSPDEFLLGNSDFITYYRFITSFDFDLIRWFSLVPLKLYLNAGLEYSPNSWMKDNLREARELYASSSANVQDYKGSSNYSKVPILLGAEFKTQTTDFYMELESEPFADYFLNLFQSKKRQSGDRTWVRYNFVASGQEHYLRVMDINILETPIYMTAGAKLKYGNGSIIQGGFSWMLSQDVGAKLGPCGGANTCREGASDGFSPFYPQWKLVGRISYPLKFKQSSAELYRSFLLKKNRKRRKVLDIENRLKKIDSEESLVNTQSDVKDEKENSGNKITIE